MLHCYKHVRTDAYRTAYILEKETESKVYFKYKLLDNVDLTRVENIPGLRSEGTAMVIETPSQHRFRIGDTVVINEQYYKILNISKQMTNRTNGLFMDSGESISFLSVGR